MIYTVTLNPAIDYVMHPLTLDMGFTNRSSSEEVYCGGNGINIAGILNELGVANTAMGICGGFTGDYLVNTLQDQGIAANFVRLDKGNTRINVKLNGIVMSIVNGMGPKIPESKLEELLARLEVAGEGDTVVLTGSIPASLPDTTYDMIMHRLSGRGIRFVVDAPGTLLLRALPAKPFLIKPNNHEVGRLFGAKPETPCRLVNATGAGDSMVAGFVAKTGAGADYETALNFASACGSATASSKGLADRMKIDKLYSALGGVLEKHRDEIQAALERAHAMVIDATPSESAAGGAVK